MCLDQKLRLTIGVRLVIAKQTRIRYAFTISPGSLSIRFALLADLARVSTMFEEDLELQCTVRHLS